MLRVYIVNCTQLQNEDIFNSQIGNIPFVRLEKCMKNKSLAARAQSLGASLALSEALKDMGYSADEIQNIEFKIGEHGKPYIDNMYFNLSHTLDMAVCGISDCEIGIDIEKIREFNINIGKRFFCENEYNYLLSLASDRKKQQDEFFRLWTLKESYIKANAKGLFIGLDSFEFDTREGKLKSRIIKSPDDIKWYFTEINDISMYKIAICTKNNDRACVKQLSIL